MSAQHDSISHQKVLEQITIMPIIDYVPFVPMPYNNDIVRLFNFSGKKNEVIFLSDVPYPLSEKNGRQVFARIPGVFVYDMDGTGNQTNISTRGLDAHRGWEFNIRKDGVLTNSDMYGYPASHFNVPMEAVNRIELIRGGGANQYGAQFGGMLNYLTFEPNSLNKWEGKVVLNGGSFGMNSLFTQLGGSSGKFRYSGWFSRKRSDGYRDNSSSKYESENLSLYYDASEKLKFKWDWSHSNYLIQLAGPLNDSMFHADPTMSTRTRNYYNPNIHVPSMKVNWELNKMTSLQFISSAVIGVRNSVMFDKPANVPDVIIDSTLNYANRQVDIDNFNSYTNEFRFTQFFHVFHRFNSTLIGGVQTITNRMRRRQQGVGSTGSDYDLTRVNDYWGRNMHYNTNNLALFAEYKFNISDNWSVSPGVRYEDGTSVFSGDIAYYNADSIRNEISHQFLLKSISTSYRFRRELEVYANYAEAYRPVILKDIVPASVYESVDKNLKDAHGFNSEIGLRKTHLRYQLDVSVYYLDYKNRLGTIALNDTLNNLQIYRTNIGNSRSMGCEFYLNFVLYRRRNWDVQMFNSTAYNNSYYYDAKIKVGNVNEDVSGNRVESTPQWISRTGLSFNYKKIAVNALYSFVSESYADALNSRSSNASGSVGLVPEYALLDFGIKYVINDTFNIQFNVNNATNKSYFTKRPQFYPGPGIWPSDGRGFSLSIVSKFSERRYK